MTKTFFEVVKNLGHYLVSGLINFMTTTSIICVVAIFTIILALSLFGVLIFILAVAHILSGMIGL